MNDQSLDPNKDQNKSARNEAASEAREVALSKDGASHFIYLLNAAYYDPSFTSAPDAGDPRAFIEP